MGLNKEIAERLAEQRLAEWRTLGYQEWRAMIDDSDRREIVCEDGRTYSVVSHGTDVGEGNVMMMIAVDDGGWSAFAPLTQVGIMRPDGSITE